MVRSLLFLLSSFVLASVTHSAAPDSERHTLDHMRETGALKVESKLMSELAGLQKDHYLSLLVVTLAAGRTEPVHTHPGDEILFGLSGKGAVYVDGVRHELQPGAVVHVRREQKKSLSNEGGTEPLQVLACLVLEKNKPPIEVVSQP